MESEQMRSTFHMPRQIWLFGICSVALFLPNGHAAIAEGMRYGAIGDSITHHGNYPIYLDVFYHTRFPNHPVELINLGISGGDTDGAIQRFSWDIVPRNIDVATVMMGMNDVGRDLYQPGPASPEIIQQRCQRIDSYEKNIRTLIGLLIEKKVKPILVTPSVYDDTLQGTEPNFPGVNLALAECASRVKKIGAEYHIPIIDIHTPMTCLNTSIQASTPNLSVVGSDRVHPGPPGHLAITYWILKEQQAPGEVSSVSIDAEHKKLTNTHNCTISDLDIRPGQIKFSYLANALPYPIDPEAKVALNWVPFKKDFNQETIQIQGLENGGYKLEINNQLIRTYASRELEAGVNLASEPETPQFKQAYHVLELCKYKGRIAQKLRDILMVEIGSAAELPRPVTFEQIKPLLAVRLKAAEDRPWLPYIQVTNEEYLTNKPQEKAFQQELVNLAAQVRKAAIPEPRNFVITKITP